MAQALYHAEFGYYASGRAKIGRKGDFFTSVSVGPLFGALLARQFAEIWQRLGGPAGFTIVEQGAHRGECAGDVLAALQRINPACFTATKYEIVEPSPTLRAAQEQTLREVAGKVGWVASLADVTPFIGVHFSNELIDAFPVRLVVWTGEKWLERHVECAGSGFRFVDLPMSDQTALDRLALIPQPSPGYQTEVQLAALQWIAELAPKLSQGCILAIDYGFSRREYFRPERTTGTLMARAEHRRESDPLARPGEIDLTTHVEFTSLVEAAEACGLRLAGYTDQHHFMVGLGRLHFPDHIEASPEARREMRAFKTLMHPNLMGHHFKALALSRNMPEATPLAGFSLSPFARAALDLPGEV